MTENLNQHIFKRLQNGDEKAFSELFDQYYSALCLFANKYLCDMDLSRSLVQQVFIDLWTKREKITVTSSVKSYLYTTVKNRCIDVFRKTKATTEISESVENLNQIPFRDLIEEAELNDRINASINQLPEKCREIFLLCRFEGLKYSEIAEKLGISIKTVEMQMGIALKKLRDSLSDYQMINLLVFIYSKKN
ncbi:RNA polymerase sigma-70 factor, ECF subfamily [Tangfeifania diversioriginum]|uniref:RNA polymerase sigma-70 factor, ECF subfamily n=1 Tax=Tangfeifania diversioriginum TaxID=1168035 RepID=A0A1M6K8E6_9BACT|nr:RNA polymerase sigma-70 factor [Tangfeifania diversioriginum]SHJ55241.1 RNA polymerase sigma-70 factor, ECF subfamily [Tangfeifania diversioriginum]